MSKDDILKSLNNFCKNLTVPSDVREYIDEHTRKYGKAKLILEQNKYKIEAEADIMAELREIPEVSKAHKVALKKEKDA